MAKSIEIHKKTADIWEHIDQPIGRKFTLSDFYVKSEENFTGFQIIELGGSQRIPYLISEVTVYDDTDIGTPETFANQVELFQRLHDLKYPAFDYSSDISPLYVLKSSISQDVSTDQASTIKIPSVKAVYDWVALQIATYGFWTKTGNKIRNNNTDDVEIGLQTAKSFRIFDHLNSQIFSIGELGVVTSINRFIGTNFEITTANNGLVSALFGGSDFKITSAGFTSTRPILYTADFSADTTLERLITYAELQATSSMVDTSSIIYNDNRNGNSLDMDGNIISGVSSIAVSGTGVFGGTITALNFSGSSSGSNTGDNATNTTSNTYADTKVQNSLSASTTVAPSATAVNTGLAAKLDITYLTLASGSILSKQTTNTIAVPASDMIFAATTSQPHSITGTSSLRGIFSGYDDIIEASIASNQFGTHHSIIRTNASGHNLQAGGSYLDLNSSYSAMIGGTLNTVATTRSTFVACSENANISGGNGYISIICANTPVVTSTASYISVGPSTNASITGAVNHITILGGATPTASGGYNLLGQGQNNTTGSNRSTVLNGTTNSAPRNESQVLNGDTCTANGVKSTVINGLNVTAASNCEVAMGQYSTTYSPTGGVSTFNTADRAIVYGNGTGTGARSDAWILFKNGNSTQAGTATVATPTASGHATTKAYVDGLVGTAGSFSGVGTATTTFTVTIGATQPNNTYKVVATPTNLLSAAVFYITNKTTTTFDVVYLAGLTGTVTFDWILKP